MRRRWTRKWRNNARGNGDADGGCALTACGLCMVQVHRSAESVRLALKMIFLAPGPYFAGSNRIGR